jgi:uncharacterized protein (DUF1697 family)
MAETPTPMAAFLRGINVGGRSLLTMAELVSALADAGLGDVRTYLQSGNVVVTPRSADPGRLATVIEQALEARSGRPIKVMVRTGEELAAIVASNPIWDPGLAPVTLHTVFLETTPESSRLAELDPDRSPPDRFAVCGREIYLHYPNGSGRSKLGLDYFERVLGMAGTARNWNTVTKVSQMLEE